MDNKKFEVFKEMQVKKIEANKSCINYLKDILDKHKGEEQILIQFDPLELKDVSLDISDIENIAEDYKVFIEENKFERKIEIRFRLKG